MPIHGLKADIELAVLVFSAVALSHFFTGQVVANVFFTSMLVFLFFLMGLHLDLSFFDTLRSQKAALLTSLVTAYILVPLFAYIMYLMADSSVFLVLGASAAALGTPKVFSNLSGGDGDLAASAGSLTVLGSIITIPAILHFYPINISFSTVSQNLTIAFVPLVVGVIAQNYETEIIEDMRTHFSKVAFWLITLIAAIQFQISLGVYGVNLFPILFLAAGFFALFILLSFVAGHLFAKTLDLYEKEARAIGFLTGSRNVAIAFFIAVHFNGLAILLVGLYYFIRQLLNVVLTEILSDSKVSFHKKLGF